MSALIGSDQTAKLAATMVNTTHPTDYSSQASGELTSEQPSLVRACIGFTVSTLAMIASCLLIAAIWIATGGFDLHLNENDNSDTNRERAAQRLPFLVQSRADQTSRPLNLP